MDVDILSSLLTLDKTSKLFLCSLNRSLGRHPDLRRKCVHGMFGQRRQSRTPDLNLSEKIIGKWVFYDRNGELTPTNKKRIFTFVSTTKAYVS